MGKYYRFNQINEVDSFRNEIFYAFVAYSVLRLNDEEIAIEKITQVCIAKIEEIIRKKNIRITDDFISDLKKHLPEILIDNYKPDDFKAMITYWVLFSHIENNNGPPIQDNSLESMYPTLAAKVYNPTFERYSHLNPRLVNWAKWILATNALYKNIIYFSTAFFLPVLLLGLTVAYLAHEKNYDFAILLGFIGLFYTYLWVKNSFDQAEVNKLFRQMLKEYPEEYALEIPELVEAVEVGPQDKIDPTTTEEKTPQKTLRENPVKSSSNSHFFFDINREYKRDPVKISSTPSERTLLPASKPSTATFTYPAGSFKGVNQELKATEKNRFYPIHNHNLPGISRFFSFVNRQAIDEKLSTKDQRDYADRIEKLTETTQHGLIVAAEGKNGIKQLRPPIWYNGDLITWEAKRTDMPSRLLGVSTRRIYNNTNSPQAAVAIDFRYFLKNGLH